MNGLAKSMIFGTPSVTSYAVGIHFLYPRIDIFPGTVVSAAIAVGIGMCILSIRDMIT